MMDLYQAQKALLINGMIILLCSINIFSQELISNPGFEKTDLTSDTRSAAWDPKGDFNTCLIDSNQVFKGKYSMKISRKMSTGMGEFKQEFSFKSNELTRYKISCAVKAEGLKGKAGIGARIFDKNGNTITGYNAYEISKDQDWKIIEGEFYSDQDASRIRIFCDLEGEGIVWFDEIRIETLPLSEKKPGKKILNYISEYFNYVHQYSVVRDSFYIDQLQSNTLKLCAGHNDLAYCENILKRYTTLKLNDGHSFFWTSEEWKDYKKGSNNVNMKGLLNFPSGRMTDENIAYINVPTFASLDMQIIANYIDSTQQLIKQMDTKKTKGWIIDLSNNRGGNSYAMIAALGPLLGNGICGYSQSADGSYRTRIYNNGWVGWLPDTIQYQKNTVYQVINKDLPIAVIYGNITGSAGEVTAIAFRGIVGTKSFGEPTSGTTTRVDNIEMSNGAVLNLACGWDADRTHIIYTTKVPPDVETQTHEDALKEATIWILYTRK